MIKPDPSMMGQWELLPYDSQIEAVHMSLLPTGKVIYYSGFRVYEAIPTETRLWDPRTGEIKSVDTPGDLFCAGHCFLPDGRLLSTGGTLEYRNLPPIPPWLARFLRPVQKLISRIGRFLGFGKGMDFTGATFLYIFDPHKEQWEFAGDMAGGRWYPTNTLLPDGTVLLLSGFDEGGGKGKKDPTKINRRVEVFDPHKGLKLVSTIPDFSRASRGHSHDSEESATFPSDYPRMLVLPRKEGEESIYPAGKVFCAGYAPETKMLNLSTWEWEDVDTLRFGGMRHDGCVVLLPLCPPHYQAKVLHFGGSTKGGMDAIATNSAEMIDFDKPKPTWDSINFPKGKRVNGAAILLPDGNILALSGNSTARWDDPVFGCEIFNPETGVWNDVAPMTIGRGYHGTAVLLPDGRVLSAGSTPLGNMRLEMEVYSPSYLFKGPRPVIKKVKQNIAHANPFEINYEHTGAHIQKAVLITPGSMTHAFDMHQRYIELKIETQDRHKLVVTAPPDIHVAPQGFYMLFLLSELGVPSEAKFVQL